MIVTSFTTQMSYCKYIKNKEEIHFFGLETIKCRSILRDSIGTC